MSDAALPFPLQEFIESTPWVFAKTYAKTWPHEYIVRDRVDQSRFLELVSHIRQHGYQGEFYRKPITYFDYEGRVYWTMGAPIEETNIVNRCQKEQSYEYRRDHGLLPEQQALSDTAKQELLPEEPRMLCFPGEVTDIQVTCALRFAGYKYESQIPGGKTDRPILAECSRYVVNSLTLYDDPLKAFAAFFALQRYLFKWGGERLKKHSPEHIAFDFLFLHLYRHDVPEEFADECYTTKWLRFEPERIESSAAHVRQSFARVGSGPLCV